MFNIIHDISYAILIFNKANKMSPSRSFHSHVAPQSSSWIRKSSKLNLPITFGVYRLEQPTTREPTKAPERCEQRSPSPCPRSLLCFPQVALGSQWFSAPLFKSKGVFLFFFFVERAVSAPCVLGRQARMLARKARDSLCEDLPFRNTETSWS